MTRAAIIVVLSTGCIPDAPTQPSFQLDVMPILAANCIRCHGYPAIGGAPTEIRLDAFADTILLDGVVKGAATLAPTIAMRTRDETMPPRFPLDEYQITVLERWSRDPVRGEARAENRAPTIEIVDVVHASSRVELRVVVTDPDGDLVSGVIRATSETASELVGVVYGGHATLTWKTLERGTFQLTATLDDGAAPIEIELGAITLEDP